jgi:hypothetical protein
MTKEIEFTPYYRNFEDDPKEQIPIYWWLNRNLDEGCLEKRLKKISSLIALMGVDWLVAHPEDIDEAAYAIECNGRDHKVIHDR